MHQVLPCTSLEWVPIFHEYRPSSDLQNAGGKGVIENRGVATTLTSWVRQEPVIYWTCCLAVGRERQDLKLGELTG